LEVPHRGLSPLNGRFSLTGAHTLTLMLQADDVKEFHVQGTDW
jgi:hypothetical protein